MKPRQQCLGFFLPRLSIIIFCITIEAQYLHERVVVLYYPIPLSFMKRSFPFFLVINFCLLLPLTLPAFVGKDTLTIQAVDTFRYKFFTGNLFKTADQKEAYNLHGFEHYDLRGSLGNSGQAILNYYAWQPVAHLGFRFFQNDFAPQLMNEDSVRYSDAHQPYTKLFLIAGQYKEANFSFVHSQNVNKNLNFTASFKRIRSTGTYLRQNTNLTSFYISSNYKSPGKRYYLLANVIYNVDKPLVNGGIKNDSDVVHASLGANRALYPVNLNGAQRRYRNRAYNMVQFFNLGYHPALTDSLQPLVFCPTSAFSISTRISDEAIVYSDLYPDSGYYSNVMISHLLTHDSVYFYRIRNAIGWNTWEMKRTGAKRKIGLFLNAENEFVQIKQLAGDTAIVNWVAHAGIFTYADTALNYKVKVTGEYGLAGYNAGDYRADLSAEKSFFSRKVTAGLDGVASLARPDLMSEVYSGNNFSWRTHFDKEGSDALRAFIRSDRYQLEVGGFIRHSDHPVYYNTEALPWQLPGTLDITGAYAYKKLDLGKWCFVNRITWQSVPSNDAIRLPEWVTEHSLYYHNSIKHILYYQLGVDVFYFSSFLANSYMPATGQFYTQDQKSIGNYPYGDLFLNVQVRTVRVFIKYEHINAGIPSYSFFLAPGYAAPDRALKFGVSWIFNN
jgi:hypothetical protein